ncbi:hypothetical protein LY76DRAFT_665950, partial [Colletotrichum caudatum]
DVVNSGVLEVLVPVRSIVEVDSLGVLDCVAVVISDVVEGADVLRSDVVSEAAVDELALDEGLRVVEDSASDEVLLLFVEIEESVNVVELPVSIDVLDSEVVLRSDDILDSVEMLETVEEPISLELRSSVELEADWVVVLESEEKLDSDVDVAMEGVL